MLYRGRARRHFSRSTSRRVCNYRLFFLSLFFFARDTCSTLKGTSSLAAYVLRNMPPCCRERWPVSKYVVAFWQHYRSSYLKGKCRFILNSPSHPTSLSAWQHLKAQGGGGGGAGRRVVLSGCRCQLRADSGHLHFFLQGRAPLKI